MAIEAADAERTSPATRVGALQRALCFVLVVDRYALKIEGILDYCREVATRAETPGAAVVYGSERTTLGTAELSRHDIATCAPGGAAEWRNASVPSDEAFVAAYRFDAVDVALPANVGAPMSVSELAAMWHTISKPDPSEQVTIPPEAEDYPF